MKKLTVTVLHVLLLSPAIAEVINPPSYSGTRIHTSIRIDGTLDEPAWKTGKIANQFRQLEPVENSNPGQNTEVILVYDNTSLYIGAMMYDTAPDSILHELGNRDEGDNLNADEFRLGLDPYNKRQDGYVFAVTASGVQSEFFRDDLTFDAVWESAVSIVKNGWIVEIRIPYSAIRFPKKEEQTWGIQFARLIRRTREYDQWSLTPKNVQNKMTYWGTLTGLSHIDPPFRLSVTPYLSVYAENAPTYTLDGTDDYESSYTYSGGADLKVGLDERFTLDCTLLPDFSQVQSDNKVKNLSAFETIYEERRPFFKEGTDLFNKGNLFYSRRIGRTPGLYYDIPFLINNGERIVDNPDKARLINATKISGRTDRGLGIGILNAITGNTYATVAGSDGSRRKILTEPFSNYNILVMDQQLKNNSEAYIANSSVLREGSARDANVTSGFYAFENKKHTYRISGMYSHSKIVKRDSSNVAAGYDGNMYQISIEKISGSSQAGITYDVSDKHYDKNDMGYNFTNDYSEVNAWYTFFKFNPFWKHFRQGNLGCWIDRAGKLSVNNVQTSLSAGINMFLLFNNNWSFFGSYNSQIGKGKDYYEPRVPGRYYSTPTYQAGSINITTDYNRTLAFDFGARTSVVPALNSVAYGYYIIPMIRISDKWNIKLSYYWDIYNHDYGFVTFQNTEADDPIFGSRKITTIENTISTRYLFKNDMSLSLIARHYWSKGIYDSFYSLREDGGLTKTNWDSNENFNSSYFTVDLVYNWQFAPGSSFLITYKNQIFSDNQETESRYFKNLSYTFDAPQMNSVSLKVLYYLDYQKVFSKKR